MAKKPNEYPDDFFRTNQTLAKISAIWSPVNNASVIKRILYYSYGFVWYAVALIFFICEFLILDETSKITDAFVSHIGLLFTHIVGILKVFLLVYNEKKLLKLIDLLQDPNYQYASVRNFQPGLRFAKEKMVNSTISVTLYILYGFVGVSAHISSVIAVNRVIKTERFEGNQTCYNFMPYYFRIPFPTETKVQCGYAFMFMDVALGVFAFWIACHDGLFVGLLNCLKTQLVIVGEAFRTLKQRIIKQADLPENYNIFHDINNPELENLFYQELSHCTKHLNILLRARDDIESIFSYITLVQALASLFIFASCLYVASSVPLASPEFFAQAEYFMCVLIQLSLTCWFGDEITTASDLIRLRLYECDWFSSSRRFKVSMILTMCRMQRPVYLSIGKFTPITLATLVAVCRGSFSYFALFKSIQ